VTNWAGVSTYGPTVISAANTYGVPPDILLNQVNQESGFNTTGSDGSILTSIAGALGIAQILPNTASNPGYGLSPVNPADPIASINFMAQYDAAMYQKTGSWTNALEAYNAGYRNMSAGAPYASAILNGQLSTSNVPTGGMVQPSWMPDWLFNAVKGESAAQAMVTGQTVNGVTPQAAGQAASQTVGLGGVSSALSGLNSAISSALSKNTWTDLAAGSVGVIVILAALFWLAQSGRLAQS
jgi:Transglycosylase SLT domain